MRLGQLLKETRKAEWLAPRYMEYIANPDFAAEAEHAHKILTRPERDRSKGWSASSAGTCLRQQMYKARKAEAEPYNERALRALHNGSYMHLRHQTAGLVAGYLNEVEVAVEIPDFNVLGTMDGITSIEEIAEYKSINPRWYSEVAQFGPQKKHLRQVNAYMQASGINRARVLYENKGFGDLKEFLVEADEKAMAANTADWKELNDRLEDGTLPPMLPECMVQEGEFKWCPFAKTCLADQERSKLRIRRTSSSVDVSVT